MDNDFSSDIFKKIVFQMSEGVLFLDDADIIRICNPAAEKIRNVRATRILGQSIYSIHPPKMHHRIRELLSGLKEGRFSSSKRLVSVGTRYFDNSYAAVRDPSGAYVGTLLISRDVTENKRLAHENLHLKRSLSTSNENGFVAQSDAMKRVLEIIDSVASIDSTVLVTGENGTGKELIVERIHHQSPRSSAPLVRVNCAALPESLIESELFGHVRISFTGAIEDRKGKFEMADGGTIFLDEIGEIPLTSQAKLLRVLQERVVQPVGGRREIHIDVRIVAATNRDLSAEVKRGLFREDLFYRLNVINLHTPPFVTAERTSFRFLKCSSTSLPAA